MRVLRSRWPLLGVAALAAALAFAYLQPGEASAHAVLERSLPVQNQQLAEAPELVETWYSESLERSLTRLEVVDTQGNAVHVGETLFSDDPRYAAIALAPDLGPGIYTMTYENVSTVDGHIWSGFISFVVLEEDGSVPAGEALIPGGLAGQGFLPEHADSALRWLGLVAAVVLAGGLFFALLVAGPAAQFLERERVRELEASIVRVTAATVVPAAAAVALSTAGQLLVLVDRLSVRTSVGEILFDTRNGELWLSRLGLSVALLLLFGPALSSDAFRRSKQASLAVAPASIGALGLLITYALGSHAAADGGAFWAVASDFVHFAATAAWLGALVQLALVFWWTARRMDGASRVLYQANVLDRFSWLSVVSVVLLLGTGVFNGLVQLPTWPALWETTYGRVLIVKLALIVPVLAVAAVNALFLKPALVGAIDALHDEEAARRPRGRERTTLEARLQRLSRVLPRTVVAEFLLGAVVLASVSVLAQSTTAAGELRVDASRPTGDFAAVEEADGLDVKLTISPFGIGVNSYTVRLEPQAGAELGEVLGTGLIARFDDPSVAPSAGTSGTRLELEETDEAGVWAVEAALMTQPGDWGLQTRIRRRGLDDSVANFSVRDVGGFLARREGPDDLFDLPFTFVDWNIVAGGAAVALGLGAFLIWHNRPPVWQRSTSTTVGLSSAVALAAGVVLLFGVHAHEVGVPRNNPEPATAASLAAGSALFERNCLGCHGATGEGDGLAAAGLPYPPPRLGDHVPYHSDSTIFLWISEGLPLDQAPPIMPAFASQLSEEERWHIINYLKEAFGSGSFEPVLPEDLTEAQSGE